MGQENEQLLTPPYRVGQNVTHVFVEAQCPDTPSTAKPQAVCQETVFALRCPPYYLPLHFPAPLKPDLVIHHNGSVVRVDLEKATQGLSFIGLDDLQPTLFADEPPAPDEEAQTAAGPDEAADAILKDVLEREGMTSVKEEILQNAEEKRSKAILFSDMSPEQTQEAAEQAEALEDRLFDEHAYLDSYVDEQQEVAELLKWQWEMPQTAAASSSKQRLPQQEMGKTQLGHLLVDILYAYHLALLSSSGPPIPAWLLTALSRSLSSPAAPPLLSQVSVESTLRSGYRRGLVFPLHRHFKLCQRAANDLKERLQSGSAAVEAGLSETQDCLKEGERDQMEGPAEAERWRHLRKSVVEPLQAQIQDLDDDVFFTSLAEEISLSIPKLTKAKVGATWDLELLEQMADETLAEEGECERQEARLQDEAVELKRLCSELTPPLALREGQDAFAEAQSADEQAQQRIWLDSTVPDSLHAIKTILRSFSLAQLRRPRQILHSELSASVVTALSRFLVLAPWSSPTSIAQAQHLLNHSLLRPSLSLIQSILQQHIRALFATPDRPTVTDQGRLHHDDPNLSSVSRSSYAEEGEVWKGSRATSEEGGLPRAGGAGTHLTLGLCLSGIASLSKASAKLENRENAWETLWPWIVPPLVTLIETADPVWRQRGTRLLLDHILTATTSSTGSPESSWDLSDVQSERPMGGRFIQPQAVLMLRRSGLIPLLRERLSSSLTYLSHPSGGLLHQQAAFALFYLAQATSIGSGPQRAIEDEKERVQGLMTLMHEAILRVWSFLPKSIADVPAVNVETPQVDALSTTFLLLRYISVDLGFLSARYLDVTLEFLAAQIQGLYDALVVSRTEPEKQSLASTGRAKRRKMLIHRTMLAVQAVESLVTCACQLSEKEQVTWKSHNLPPNLGRWCTTMVIAYLKAFLALVDAGLLGCQTTSPHLVATPGLGVAELAGGLKAGWTLWKDLFPAPVDRVEDRVLAESKASEGAVAGAEQDRTCQWWLMSRGDTVVG